MRKVRIAVALAALLSVATTARADVPRQPDLSLNYSNLTAIRVNPLGLLNFAQVNLRFRLYNGREDISAQNYFGLGVTAAVTPAWARLGIRAEVQPLTILKLYAQYEFSGFFGTFNQLATFPRLSADYSDSTINERGDDPALDGYATTGSLLTLGAKAQIQVGPLVVQNLFRALRGDFNLQRAGDTAFYEPVWDMIIPDEGWALTNDLDVLAQIPIGERSLFAGVRWTHTTAIGTSESDPDADTRPSNAIHRLGLLAALRFFDDPGDTIERGQLILVLQWHLQHRYRTGQDVAQGIPYFGLAYQFQGELIQY